MNISVKGEYALKAIFDLACQDVGQPREDRRHLQRQRIPQKFSSRFWPASSRTVSWRAGGGAEGGYMLARPAEAITVAQVLEFVEGPAPPRPVARARAKRHSRKCGGKSTRRSPAPSTTPPSPNSPAPGRSGRAGTSPTGRFDARGGPPNPSLFAWLEVKRAQGWVKG